MRRMLKMWESIKHRWPGVYPNGLIFGIVLGGIAARCLFLSLFSHLGEEELMDTTRYLNVALNILTGRGFAEYIVGPTAFAPPVYPYFLAGVFKVFGYNMIHAKIVQAVIGGLTCWIVYRLGFQAFGTRIGLLAAACAAVFPDLIILAGYLYSETVYIALLCLGFLSILKACKEPQKWRHWIVGGILLGLCILTRHVILLFPVFIMMVLFFFKSIRLHWKRLLVFTGICYLMIVPWTIRNYLYFHEFIPVAAGSGGTFWIGSNVEHQGEFRYSDTMQEIDEETGGVKVDIERDKILMERAIDNIADNPLQYTGVVAKKFIHYFIKIYEAVPHGQPRQLNIFVTIILALSYYPLLLMFLVGIVLSRRDYRCLIPLYGIVLYSGVIYALTVVVPRYRAPLLPFFIVFAAYGVYRLAERWFSFKERRSHAGTSNSVEESS